MTDSTIKVDNTRLFPSTNGPSAYKNGKYLSTYCKVECGVDIFWGRK